MGNLDKRNTGSHCRKAPHLGNKSSINPLVIDFPKEREKFHAQRTFLETEEILKLEKWRTQKLKSMSVPGFYNDPIKE